MGNCSPECRPSVTNVSRMSRGIIVRLLCIACAISVFIFKSIVRVRLEWFDGLMLGFAIMIVVEMLYTAIWRKGKEWKWFSPSTFALLLAILPSMWELQLCETQCLEGEAKETAVKGIALATVFLVMFGKWMIPTRKLPASEHSLLLIAMVASGADITDILELAKEKQICAANIASVTTQQAPVASTTDIVEGRKHSPFVIVVLTAYSLSLLQLCLSTTLVKTLPATDFNDDNRNNRAKKKRSIPKENKGSNKSYSSIRCSRFCFFNEIWALVVCLLCQDIVFLVLRGYAIGRDLNRETSTFYFAIKNLVIILVALNRMRIIFKEEYRPWKEQCNALRTHERAGQRYLASDNIGFNP